MPYILISVTKELLVVYQQIVVEISSKTMVVRTWLAIRSCYNPHNVQEVVVYNWSTLDSYETMGFALVVNYR